MKRNKAEMFEKAPVSKAVLFNTIPAIFSMVMVMIYNLAIILYFAVSKKQKKEKRYDVT